MAEKIINTRIINKHAVESDWLKAVNFTPKQGELIVYDRDSTYDYERFKIGDGITPVNDLEFVSAQSDYEQNDSSKPDYIKNRTHYKEVIHQEKVDLLPATEIDFSSLGGMYSQSEPLDIQVGDTVKVLWDSQEYECVAQSVATFDTVGNTGLPSDCIVFGNLYYIFEVDPDSRNIPFVVIANYTMGEQEGEVISGCFIQPTSELTNPITVNIFTGGDKVVYHKLDVNYLPISESNISSDKNNIVTSKPLLTYLNINRPDWEISDKDDPRYIKNRPFYRSLWGSTDRLISRTITLDKNGIYASKDLLYNFNDIYDNSYGDISLTVYWHDGTYNCNLRHLYAEWTNEYGELKYDYYFAFGNVSDINYDYSSDSAPFLIYADFNPETHKTGETYIKAYDGFTGELTLQVDAEYRYWGYNTLNNKYLDIISLQARWNEENSSSPSYIYNKPCYRYRGSGDNHGSSNASFELNNEGTCTRSFDYLNINEKLNDNEPTDYGNITINVKWNNKEYNCRIRQLLDEYTDDGGGNAKNSYYVFGNVSSIDSNYSDTAPFLIYANYNPQTHEYGETYIVSQDGSTGEVSCEFRYSYEYWEYQKLDNKYLNLSTNVSQGDNSAVTGNAVYNSIESVKGMIPSVPSWAMQSNKPSYSASEVGADASGTATSEVSTHNTNTSAHNDLRLELKGLSNRLNALADSDDTTLDQMSEIVKYIKNNKSLIDNVTTTKVNVADIIDNLTTNVSNKPLSAAQGVALKSLIDAITVPTSLYQPSEDTNHRLVTDSEKTTWNSKLDLSATNNAIKSFFGGKTVVFSDTPPTNNDQNVITFVKRG